MQNRTRRRRGILLASAPWYEFWGQGLWQLGEWSHLHASWWVWAARGYLLLGLICVALITVAMSGGFVGGRESWLAFAIASPLVVLWLVIPYLTHSLSFFALIAPALVVYGLAAEGWEQGRKRVRRWSGAMGPLVRASSNVSSGTYRCTNCGYKMDVGWTDQLPSCPDCNNPEWETLFGRRQLLPGRVRDLEAVGKEAWRLEAMGEKA